MWLLGTQGELATPQMAALHGVLHLLLQVRLTQYDKIKTGNDGMLVAYHYGELVYSYNGYTWVPVSFSEVNAGFIGTNQVGGSFLLVDILEEPSMAQTGRIPQNPNRWSLGWGHGLLKLEYLLINSSAFHRMR